MNRLTPVFIAGAIAVSAGLVFAQSQLDWDEGTQGGHGGHSISTMDANPGGQPAAVADRAVED